MRDNMKCAYVRVSSTGQSLDRQLLDFKERGIELDRVYQEKVSGKSMKNRPQLRAMLTDVIAGDTIYVVELSRLARSVQDLVDIAAVLKERGVALVSLKESIDLSSAAGTLTYNILAAIAEFERQCIHERQAEGIAAAKAKGKQWGAKQKYGVKNRAECEEMFLQYQLGGYIAQECADQLKMPVKVFKSQFKKWRKEQGLPDEDMQGRNLGRSSIEERIAIREAFNKDEK